MQKKIFILLVSLAVLVPFARAQEPDIYKIEKISISLGQYNDMISVLTEDGIVFCSDRRISILNDVRSFDRSRMYNIFFAAKKDSIEFGKARTLSDNFSPLANEGPFCFTPDGKQIYYTSNVEQGKEALKRSGKKNNMGIFIADKDGDEWTNVRPFLHNDPLWNVAHPFISSDGKYLFFASDTPGGFGKADIWYCEWMRGQWTLPINLGPEVNSPDSELFPYFSPTQDLYFASDKAGGIGGLDLYSSSLRYGEWKAPIIMPEPINSSADDFGFIFKEGTADGLFTSNRDRSDDIYGFTSLIIRKNSCDTLVMDSFCYEFWETNAVKFDSMPFEYEWDFDDGTLVRGVRAEHCFKEPGQYLVKLNVVNLITGEQEKNKKNELVVIERTVQAFINSPDTCYIDEAVDFDAAMTNLPGWDITKYYWNFDDGTISQGVETKKVFSKAGTYLVQLIVSADPDEKGIMREACVSKIIVVQERQ